MNLWSDLDDFEDLEDNDDPFELYEDDSVQVESADEWDVVCLECGAVVEDGIQCSVCGLVGAI